MKIAQLTCVHPRRDIRIYFKQCVSLAGAGMGSVTLFVADGDGDETIGRVSVRDIGRPGRGRVGRAVGGNIKMLIAVLRARPNVVHFHDPELILTGLVLRLLGYPVIYDVHEDYPRQIMSKRWVPAAFRWPVARAVEMVEWIGGRIFTAIVPATPRIGRRFPPERTWLVQNFPVDRELVVTAPTPYHARPSTFTYIGGASETRGAREMVEAIHLLNDRTTATLEIGGTFYPPNLEEELRAAPGWAHVRYRGWMSRSEVSAVLDGSRAGLVVLHPLANYMDAQPLKMFEYMAAGLPVIASDFPLWRGILDAANCGLLVDPLDPAAIADAMEWVLDHTREAEAMGRRARQVVQRRFSWETEARTLTNLYREILSQS